MTASLYSQFSISHIITGWDTRQVAWVQIILQEEETKGVSMFPEQLLLLSRAVECFDISNEGLSNSQHSLCQRLHLNKPPALIRMDNINTGRPAQLYSQHWAVCTDRGDESLIKTNQGKHIFHLKQTALFGSLIILNDCRPSYSFFVFQRRLYK